MARVFTFEHVNDGNMSSLWEDEFNDHTFKAATIKDHTAYQSKDNRRVTVDSREEGSQRSYMSDVPSSQAD